MAKIVSVVASTHNPRIFWNRDQAAPEDMNELYATFKEVAALLADSKPDCIVTIANDHFDSYFFDNLPAFSVGIGSVAARPYWYEADIMSLPPYRVAIEQDLAKFLLRDGVESGVQFSQARDVHVDHAFTVPLSFLRPQADLPIVPIITNAFGYPLPQNMRWYELGDVPQARDRGMARRAARRGHRFVQPHRRSRRTADGQHRLRVRPLSAGVDADRRAQRRSSRS